MRNILCKESNLHMQYIFYVSGFEIATDTVANATIIFSLAT